MRFEMAYCSLRFHCGRLIANSGTLASNLDGIMPKTLEIVSVVSWLDAGAGIVTKGIVLYVNSVPAVVSATTLPSYIVKKQSQISLSEPPALLWTIYIP